MADARAAILKGTMEASRAHERLGIRDHWEQEGGRIDVFGAIDSLGLPLLFRPMEKLLGAFLPKPSPGIVVSTQRPLSVRRYTAAHELGHYLLEHEPSLDDESMLRRSPFAGRPDYDRHEIEADAFAVAFLLPRWLLSGQMRRHSWSPTDMREPANVYQLALRVGMSYEATCYALQRHKVIARDACNHLSGLQPKTIKRSIVPEYNPASWRLDVWQLSAGDDGLFVEASPGDVFEIALLEHSGGGYMWDMGGLEQTELEVLADRRERIGGDGQVGNHAIRRLTTRAKTSGFGSVRVVETRPWEQSATPLAAYQFSYDISEAVEHGLLAAQRERMLRGEG